MVMRSGATDTAGEVLRILVRAGVEWSGVGTLVVALGGSFPPNLSLFEVERELLWSPLGGASVITTLDNKDKVDVTNGHLYPSLQLE